jgi:hypothetical protein
MAPTIFSLRVEIKPMASMLDRGHLIARLSQFWNQSFNEGGFSTIGTAHETHNGWSHLEACTSFYE